MTRKRTAPALLMALLLTLLAAGGAQAAAPHFAILKVSLWPEYDKPNVLVMYDITLPGDATLPLSLDVRIPARAGEPLAVAYQQPNGNLVNAEYTYSADAQWGTIHLKAMMPNVHIEYYDPALKKDGNQREFTFHWPGGAQIDALLLVVQQPATAKDIKISPTMGTGEVAADGLTYYHAQLGALRSDQTFDLTIAYTKDDDTLSVEALHANNNTAGVPPTAAPVAGETTWQRMIPWAITLLGLILIVAGLGWYWLSTHTVPETPHRRRRSRRPLPPEALAADMETTPNKVRYCPQCGARAQPGDKFCRVCGTPLR
ncbi:MAG TPA: zinc ribbon domain-containing protein [Chloroflexi bacterium]|nr:zinc ribbon domain-containing protein [Chloroflexota bacterium]